MAKIRLAVVGLGKIARDQHLPAIAGNDSIELVAIASPHSALPDLPHFTSLEDLLEEGPEIDAVALCTPPQVRRAQAARALAAGKHVLLEKPPGTTVGEVLPLIDGARAGGVTLFASWHSRFAPVVEPARAFLAERRILSVAVEWKEDVRVWHPGQQWIWEPGGLGVFDTGINALSILTRILPRPFFLTEATLAFPGNRAAPIAARLAFSDMAGGEIRAEFDWRHGGPEIWDIAVETDAGRLLLRDGGTRLLQDGQPLVEEEEAEYRGLYRHFLQLVEGGQSDVDLLPLQQVADAFLLGRHELVEAFED